MRLAALALGAAITLCCAAPAAAQQPASQQKKLTPQQQLEQMQKKEAAQNYDTYEASRRLPGRQSGCGKGEDPLGNFCVKACKKGYVEMDNRKASVRQCRSVKPLPPGVIPVKGQKEKSTVPIRAQKEVGGKAGSIP